MKKLANLGKRKIYTVFSTDFFKERILSSLCVYQQTKNRSELPYPNKGYLQKTYSSHLTW